MISKTEVIYQVTDNEYIRQTLLDGVPEYDSKFADCRTDEERIALTETYVNMLSLENMYDRESDGAAKKRLFVDMDGTMAVWNPTKKLEELYEEGYFKNLKPYEEVVEAVRYLVQNEPGIEVFVLSAYLSDSQYALAEKNEWLNTYLPEIDMQHRCFCHCGTDKSLAVPGGIRTTDHLLDDYTINLNDWCPPGVGLKLLNGINDTHKSWKGDRISRLQPAEDIANAIMRIIESSINLEEGIDL